MGEFAGFCCLTDLAGAIVNAMKSLLRPVAVAACWLLTVIGAGALLFDAQRGERESLVDRFALRAQINATFVSAYVDEVFQRERRLANPRNGALGTRTWERSLRLGGFSIAVVLDGEGRLLASVPSASSLIGSPLSDDYPYLASALAGTRTVSPMMPSEVEGASVVSFALPLAGGRDGVLSAGYNLARGQLKALLAQSPIPGTRAYIVDEAGNSVVYAGDGATSDTSRLPSQEAGQATVVEDGQVTVSAPVEGTPWRVFVTAREDAITAPASHGDGVMWGLLGAAAVLTLAGLILLGLVSASRAKVRAEQAESDQRFRLTVQHAPIGMTVVALDGTFIDPNEQLCRILGYDAEQLRHITFPEITHPDDLDADLSLLRELLAGDIPAYEMEKRYIRRDGSTVWARLTVSLVRDGAGQPLHFVSQVEDVTEMRAAQEKLERRALYDPLTGLANRSLLIDRLTHALSRRDDGDTKIAVAFCDLDHFKRVNDSLGHHAGDTLLREVSRRLQDAVRGSDTVARMGGDEFVLLLPDVESMATAQEVVDRARQAVQQPTMVDNHELTVAFSAGLAVGRPGDVAEMLLRDADTALYAAKESGRSRCEVYTSAMRSRALMHLSVEAELRRAIEGDEFELHYQPIVTLADRQIVAYEALLRWRHPSRGLLAPDAFLEIAEDAGLMIPLGALVLRHACGFLAANPNEPWRVYVNVAPVQLGCDLTGVVRSTLAAAGVPASRLGLEITENGVLTAAGSSLSEMEQLRDMGVEMLMDDFGTGYSALSSVLTTPITGLKLDRSFTARLGDGGTADRITSTVADLVHSLSLRGVVEGIETEEQCALALQHRWTLGQGYLFARPVAASALIMPAPVTGDLPEVAGV